MGAWLKDSTAADRANSARRWLKLAEEIGIAGKFKRAQEFLDRANVLKTEAGRDHSTHRDAVADIVSALADAEIDGPEAYRRLAESEAANSAAMKDIYARAVQSAEVRAFAAFDLGADTLHRIVSDVAIPLIETIREERHIGVFFTLEEARRAGAKAVASWARADEAMKGLQRVYRLANEWRANRFLPLEGEWPADTYRPIDFQWGDPERLRPASARGLSERQDPLSVFVGNLDCAPGFFTLGEVDAYRAEIRRRDEAAATALAAEKSRAR